MNNMFNNYDSENDERLDKKFKYNYQVIKNVYPKVSELPEDEVREIIRKYYDAPGTHEESIQVVMNYIHEKEPEWRKLYFKNEALDNNSRIQPMTERQKEEAEALARQIRPEMPNMFTDDIADMIYGAGRIINGMSGGGLDYLGERYGIDTRMNDYLSLKDEEGTGEQVRHLGNRALMADYKEIVDKMIKYYPAVIKKAVPLGTVAYIGGEVLGSAYPVYKNLLLRQEQMKRANTKNSDNYYHRLGMHDAGSLGLGGALAGLVGGVVKEGLDLYDKSVKGNIPWRESLSDSYKDMQNNIEGLLRGLTHHDEDARIWLKDLDINTNTWKK